MKSKSEENKHVLIPKHKKINDKERLILLEKYNISINNLPRILKKDKVISNLKPQAGDVIKISRKSPTAGSTTFYRIVINE